MTGRQTPHRRTIRKGAVRASQLVERDIRKIGESRGFAVSRLLTRWSEVVGDDFAAICKPVDVSFSRGGIGATLSVLTTGAQAPMLEMRKEKLREKVNACYGYQAIRRIHITQTSPTGFAEGPATYTPPPKAEPAIRFEAPEVGDPGLRAALERLGSHVLAARPRKEDT